MTSCFSITLHIDRSLIIIYYIGHFEPGMYAIEVLGDLPEEAVQQCENFEVEYRKIAKQNK